MNPIDTEYKRLPESTAECLSSCSDVVNDWAEKKGWNKPPTPEQERANTEIAYLTLAVGGIAKAIEDVRHGRAVDHRVLEFCNSLYPSKIPDHLVRRISQIGLMHTELVEMTEGLLGGNQPDDHVPELCYEEAEMADLFIRAFHYCGEHGLPIGHALGVKHDYNIQRPHRHGDKLA